MANKKIKKGPMTRHTFFIDDGLYAEIVAYAEREDKLISAVIRRAFRQFLDSKKK